MTEEHAAVATTEDSSTDAPGALRWDVGGLVEIHLLRLRIHIELADRAAAETSVATVAALIGLNPAQISDPLTQPLEPELGVGPLPHYTLRLYHLLGRLAQTNGDPGQAQAYYQHALTLLEQQRATLPVEEIRTSFLDDKTEIYIDLIQLLLDLAADDPTRMADAFAAVERARSRALLERLLAATSGEAVDVGVQPTEGVDESARSVQLNALRQRLHWLYNQLLGESGSRNLNNRLSEQLLVEEAALQRLEWRRSALMQQADPVDLKPFKQRWLLTNRQLSIRFLGKNRLLPVRHRAYRVQKSWLF
ncbi:MAG: hypothetical protein R2932_10905 [Caldilineaceae bacterium]